MLDASLAQGNLEAARQEAAQIREGIQESYDDVRELLGALPHTPKAGGISRPRSPSPCSGSRGRRTFAPASRWAHDRVSGGGIQPQVLHIVAEALSNVRKHARASEVMVEVMRDGGYVVCVATTAAARYRDPRRAGRYPRRPAHHARARPSHRRTARDQFATGRGHRGHADPPIAREQAAWKPIRVLWSTITRSSAVASRPCSSASARRRGGGPGGRRARRRETRDRAQAGCRAHGPRHAGHVGTRGGEAVGGGSAGAGGDAHGLRGCRGPAGNPAGRRHGDPQEHRHGISGAEHPRAAGDAPGLGRDDRQARPGSEGESGEAEEGPAAPNDSRRASGRSSPGWPRVRATRRSAAT